MPWSAYNKGRYGGWRCCCEGRARRPHGSTGFSACMDGALHTHDLQLVVHVKQNPGVRSNRTLLAGNVAPRRVEQVRELESPTAKTSCAAGGSPLMQSRERSDAETGC